MENVGLSIFAPACSKNRGAFVTQPPDGKTYGCLVLPEDILAKAGVDLSADSNSRALKEASDDEVSLDSANAETDTEIETTEAPGPKFTVQSVEDILKHNKDGNLTDANTVKILDFLVENTYASSPDVEVSPYACDVSGLVTLKCPGKPQKVPPIRAVTLAGVFTPALWATGGLDLTLDEASSFYTLDDFQEMKDMGLNTVQVPVPTKMFSSQHESAADWKSLLWDILHDIRSAGLNTILVLEQGDSPAEDVPGTVKEAAIFAQDYNDRHSDKAIIALTLPTLDSALLEAATLAAPSLDVWIPMKGGDFQYLSKYPLASAASLELSHTATIADVASSSSEEDRAKMFYHESTACISRAPIEYSECYQGMPVMIANGFDLAIDDCHMQDISKKFKDYGQCGRFNETIGSNWWKNHRFSLASRQLFAYEQGKGWSFSTWKLYGTDPSEAGILDVPAKLLALKEVAAAGLMPSLFDLEQPITYPLSGKSSPVGLACLNGPVADFGLGDATLAPTPAPPPDCGNGWWNFSTEKCDYWIPPTPAPTPGCPVCSNDTIVIKEPTDCPDVVGYAEGVLTAAPGDDGMGGVVAKSFFGGAVVASLLCVLIGKFILPRLDKRRDYEPVPAAADGYQA
jgi:hypothetical protein